MAQYNMPHDSPYEFGDVTPDGGLGVDDPPEGCEHGTDTVLVEGDAMSYRSYLRQDSG